MEHQPPPFFNRGPAPLARLAFFASLSLAAADRDARFRYAEGLRSWLALAAYPLQRARRRADRAGRARSAAFSPRKRSCARRTRACAQKALAQRADAQRFEALAGRDRAAARADRRRRAPAARGIPAEVLYDGARSLYAQRRRRQGRAARHPRRQPGDRRDRRGRPGDARAPVALGSHAAHRQGPGDPGAGGAQRPARDRLRRAAPPARSSCASWPPTPTSRTATGWSPPASTAPIRPACRWRPSCASSATPRYAFARIVCKPAAGVDRGRYVLVLVGRRSERCRRAPRGSRRSRDKAAQKGARAELQGCDARSLARSPQRSCCRCAPAPSSRRSPLALLLNFLPWRDLRLVPDFVALVLRLLVRAPAAPASASASAGSLGLLTDAGNGVLLGQHALAYSLLAFAAHLAVARASCGSAWGAGAARGALLLLSRRRVALLGARRSRAPTSRAGACFVGPLSRRVALAGGELAAAAAAAPPRRDERPI